MKNRFKFRVWDTKTKRFLEEIAPTEEYQDSEEWDDPEDLLDDCMIYPDHPFDDWNGRLVWQQFTGRKDKEGKEIFQGDIVEYESGRFGRVFYDGNLMQYKVFSLASGGTTFYYLNWDYLVVGNMFEHEDFYRQKTKSALPEIQQIKV